MITNRRHKNPGSGDKELIAHSTTLAELLHLCCSPSPNSQDQCEDDQVIPLYGGVVLQKRNPELEYPNLYSEHSAFLLFTQEGDTICII